MLTPNWTLCVEFACLPPVCVGSLQLFWPPPTLQRDAWARVNVFSKFIVGVNVNVSGCPLSVLALQDTVDLQGVPGLLPCDSWVHPHPESDNQK